MMRLSSKFSGWKWGHDPNDPDAHPDSGWQYVHIEEESEPIPKGPPRTGPDSRVLCLECRGANYRITDSQKETEIEGWGPTAKLHTDTKLLLVCPSCGAMVRMFLSALERVWYEQDRRGDA